MSYSLVLRPREMRTCKCVEIAVSKRHGEKRFAQGGRDGLFMGTLLRKAMQRAHFIG